MRNAPKKFDIELIRSVLEYEKETGFFFWKVKPSHSKISVGDRAGTLLKNGYVMIRINKRGYLAHRLAWAIIHGESPVQMIDHINGIKTDNSIENIRPVTRSQNLQNQYFATARNKTSHFLGVSLFKKCNKFRATININGKNKHLGTFDSEELAHEEYVRAKKTFHISQQKIELDAMKEAA